MKRILIILVLFLSIFTCVACDPSSIEIEVNNIIGLIPDTYDQEYELPKSNRYTVTYLLDDKDTGERLWYDITNKNQEDHILTVIVSDDNKSVSKTKAIRRLFDQEKYTEYVTCLLEGYISDYEALYPAYISETLEENEYTFASGVSSNIFIETDLEYKNKQYVYNYPEEQSTFTINITLSKDGIEVSDEVVIPVLSIEQRNMVTRIYLTVDSTITRNEYTNGIFELYTKEDNEWVLEDEALSMRIKGRGNSTWGFDKKPYKIKFDSRVGLFGEKKAKTWTLIANYIDHSLMRNYAAYFLGRSLEGLEHTTCGYFVDVYLNGEYQGNYLLCEQVESDKNRLDINTDMEGDGFLIEMDGKYFDSNSGTEGIDYFYSKLHGDSYLFAVHEPDPEDITKTRVTSIKSTLDKAISALKANTDAMYDYFDLDSVVDSFIVNEITKNKDVGWSSFNLYKDNGGKICIGPIWDYDLSSLAQGNISASERSAVGWYSETPYKNPFYDYFLRNETFKKAVKDRWDEIRVKQLRSFIDELYRVREYIYYSALENFKKWDVIGKDTGWWISDEEHALKTWQEQVDLLIDYYNDRIEWMTAELKKW